MATLLVRTGANWNCITNSYVIYVIPLYYAILRALLKNTCIADLQIVNIINHVIVKIYSDVFENRLAYQTQEEKQLKIRGLR